MIRWLGYRRKGCMAHKTPNPECLCLNQCITSVHVLWASILDFEESDSKLDTNYQVSEGNSGI